MIQRCVVGFYLKYGDPKACRGFYLKYWDPKEYP